MSGIFLRFRKVFSNRAFTGALVFVTFLYVFEEILFDFPQIRFFSDHSDLSPARREIDRCVIWDRIPGNPILVYMGIVKSSQ